jgi:hydrogenase maturation protease
MTHRSDRSLRVAALARVEGEGAMRVRVERGVVTDMALDIYEPPRFFEALLRGRHHTEPYRRDDGLGPYVVERLRERGLPDVVLATSLGETTELLDLWDGADLAIVVDAVRATPAHPGRVHRLTVFDPPGERSRAAHGLDLAEAVELARVLGRLPVRLVLYAVEVAVVGYGTSLSPEVTAAAARVADEIAGGLAADTAT